MSDPAQSPAEIARERALALLDGDAYVGGAENERLDAAMTDLFRPEGYRLSDLERAIMRHLLEQLVSAVEDDLRVRLLGSADLSESPEFSAALGSDRIEIALPILKRTQMLRTPELVSALLRRNDEFGLIRNLRKNTVAVENSVLDGLIEHDDPAIAAAAMEVLVAESRRSDRFEDPVLSLADLPQSVQTSLVWTIAAALREYGVQEHGIDPASLDHPVEGAGRDLISETRAEGSLERSACGLAEKLGSAGLLDERLLLEAIAQARPSLYVALLASKCHVSYDTAWRMAAGGNIGHHALVLRMADVGREAATHLLVAMARAGDIDEAGVIEWADIYSDLSQDSAQAMITALHFDQGYGQAIRSLAAAKSGFPQ